MKKEINLHLAKKITLENLSMTSSHVAVFWKCPLLPSSLLQSNVPLFPTQIARMARLSQIGCNKRTLDAIFGQTAHFNSCSKISKIYSCAVFLKESGPVFWRRAGFRGK